MFFHTHVLYAKKVDASLSKLKIIGAMLPDFALSSLISWDDLHKKNNIEMFSEYVKANKPEYKDLLIGILYHNALDYLSHLKYKDTIGYAYKNVTIELQALLMEAFSIDENNAHSKGHNFIETSVEEYTLRDYPDLSIMVKQAIETTDLHELAKLLADFYHKPQGEVVKKLEEYFALATTYDLQNTDDWLHLWNTLSLLMFGREPDREKIKEALELALAITKDTYKDFLAAAVEIKVFKLRDSN